MNPELETGVDLYWLPLGAGGHFVRLNGRVFEALAARLERRAPSDLYHSALKVRVPEGCFVIEQAPVRDSNGGERGVVAEGAVGSRWAGRLRTFRYEVRCWCGGVIPDVDEAVESPQRLTDDPELARRVLDVVPHVPAAVWGRDELALGEMWNSNSVIAWLGRPLRPACRVDPSSRGWARARLAGWTCGRAPRRSGCVPQGPSAAALTHSRLSVRTLGFVRSRWTKEAHALTLIWFVIWLIADVVGDNESLTFDPVNWWAGTLMLVVALDLSRQHAPQFGRARAE